MTHNHNGFDERAKTWDTEEKIERGKKVAEIIREELGDKKVARALDFGCGTGLLSFPLQDRFDEIILMDSSKGMLEVVQEKIDRARAKNMHVRKGDILEMDPAKEKPFDVISTMLVLHHVEDISAVLKKFYNLLDRAGTLFIIDLEKEDGSFHGEGFPGHKGFDLEILKEELLAMGFLSVEARTIFSINKETQHGNKDFPVFLLRADK